MSGVADRIALTGLRARGFHGVFPEERRDGQDFVTDVVVHLDVAPAAATDDLSLTVNYAEVAGAVLEVVTGEPVDLIETVAERIARSVLDSQPVAAAVDVTVHKPGAPIEADFADVAVTVSRSRP
ncbi:dihydroneopterin aldolase [Citricoccus sp. SGAir0253]|uniref:dihydroneopterin aldolase n=1 Tax=Citricoccus sp. SGAir0253 TaxID=2567881 RepID=UPI0010CD3733|nr:dihydroneopterin aldolase [Citricoccus sp. SGAir0253]QCU76848.1 dihydroneopterin aldolase [Citricoccus sp. SGAir0253]